MNNPPDKNCCVRLPKDIHAEAKAFAYKHGFTLQGWITWLIADALQGTSTDWKVWDILEENRGVGTVDKDKFKVDN